MSGRDFGLLGDKAYSHPSTRSELRSRRIKHTIPERKDQIARRNAKGSTGGRPPAFDAALYGLRNTVERGFNRLKQWRGVATRYDKYALTYLGGVLLVAAFVVPHLHLGIVTPLINARRDAYSVRRHRADLRVVERPRRVGHHPGRRHRHRRGAVGPDRGAAAAVAGADVGDMGDVVRMGVLAGDDRRLAARFRRPAHRPPRVSAPGAHGHRHSRRRFALRPENPGLPARFVDHPRVRASTGRAADVRLAGPHRAGRRRMGGLLCLLVGSSAAAAIVVAVRALADEDTARLAAPFVAVAPTAIWIAVSADGYFAGVAAWGIALLALAARRTVRVPVLAAAGAGLLLGWAIFLNYGLALIAAGPGGADRRRRLAIGAARAGARRRGRAAGCRGVRRRGVLVVRRLYPGAGTLLAGYRQRSTVPVLVVGEPGVGGVCDRVGQRGRDRAGPSISRRSSDARACTSSCSAPCWPSCLPT